MKRTGLIIGFLLVLLIAGSGCHNLRHHMREMKESSDMYVMRWHQHFRHFGPMWNMHGRMAQGMRNERMRGMGHGMGMMRDRGPGMGMMRGMGRMPMDSIGWMPAGPGKRILESIPNVTENQKKQIEDLIKKQQDEMAKLREEMSAKMKNLRDSHRKDILNILTDEQKKYIQPGPGKS
jgi:gas vesicle protein